LIEYKFISVPTAKRPEVVEPISKMPIEVVPTADNAPVVGFIV
jgi:hypothetical protein